MGRRQGAERDAVAVDILVATEVGARLEHFRGHDLAAVEAAAVVPLEGGDQPFVHAHVEVEHDEDHGLQPVGQIEGLGAHFKAFPRAFGQQQDVSP